MRGKTKKIIAAISALAMVAQLGFVIPVSAAGEYYTQNYESETARGTDNNKTGDKQEDNITLGDNTKWYSFFGAGGMAIASDTNTAIGKYFKYEIGSTSGQRGAYNTLNDGARALNDDKQSVLEMDFKLSGNGGGNQIILSGAKEGAGGVFSATTFNTNSAFTSTGYAVALYQNAEHQIILNSINGKNAPENTITTGYSNGTWAHIKAVMDFKEDTVVASIKSLDGATTYLAETKVAMGENLDAPGAICISEPRNNGSIGGIDNFVLRPYADGDVEGVYYMATINVDGKTFTRTADTTTGLISDLPETAKTGYIFDGWQKDDDAENLMTNEQVLTTPISANVTYTAVYHKNPDYIEPLVGLEFSAFPTNNLATLGEDANTPADNIIQVKLNGELGTSLVTSEGVAVDNRVDDLDVKWKFDGFRTVVSKNESTTDLNENEYCDSYAEVVPDETNPTKVNFKLKGVPFNFYGAVTATVTYHGETMTITREMAILGNTSSDASVILPKPGYVSDFSPYENTLLDYKLTTSGDNKSASDVITGDWAAYGGNSGRGLYLKSDDEGAHKFLKLKSTGTNSSSFAANKLSAAPTGQVIISQDVRFYNANSGILFKQENPVTWNDNATAVSFNFTGNAFNINGSDDITSAAAGVWYHIVIAADVTSKLCNAEVYDMNGNLLGKSETMPFTNLGATAPVYLCYRTPDNAQGELDFNNVKVYVPEIAGELTTTISNDTLVIPTSVLDEGMNINGSTVTLKKTGTEDGTEATLISAAYANGVLLSTKLYPLTFKDGVASATNVEKGKGTKLYVWDSVEGMKPLVDTPITIEEDGNANVATLTVSAQSTEGYSMIGNATWTVTDESNNESDFVKIAADKNDSHKATLTVSEGAAAGVYTVTVSMGGKTKTIEVTVTGNQESVKFTKQTTSIAIPLEEGAYDEYEYEAKVVDKNNTDLQKPVTYAMYDKNNVQPLANTDAISFDAATGKLKVTSAAKGSVVYIRATSENSDGDAISRAVKVTIHGLAFDFGTTAATVEGYTSVSPTTSYSAKNGYGITNGTATAAGTPSVDNPDSDYLSGAVTFRADITDGVLYTVDVTYCGTLKTGILTTDLAGYTLGANETLAKATYIIPGVNGMIDLQVSGSNAQLASVIITKEAQASPNLTPHIFTVGDSTIANNGSWAYVMARDYASYANLPNIASFSNNGRGGKNLSSYYTGGEFKERVLTEIKPGDYVMIGDMGTNGEGADFEGSFNYYIDACEKMGAKIILNSYSPHGAVGGYANGYDAETHTFNSYRQDHYDEVVRKIYAERTNAESDKYDENVVGFVDIGKMADAAFNAYVADYETNDYADENAAAQAIIKCFGDHNHYSEGPLAAQLMILGYGDGDDAKGIVKSLYEIISADLAND